MAERHIDLQTKIIFVLVGVLVPFYTVSTILQNQATEPLLEQELRQNGVTASEALASEIVSKHLYSAKDATRDIERLILEKLYFQPNIMRMDVMLKDGDKLKSVASNVDDDPYTPRPDFVLADEVTSELVKKPKDKESISYWDINVPIRQVINPKKNTVRVVGLVRVLVSTKSIVRIQAIMWRVSWFSAGLSIVVLVFVLNFFLRKTISNERLLRRAESQNLELSEQLHDAQRQMMNVEKLAVMGELTASFAHEIGTPLNALGGHLQLLREELRDPSVANTKRSIERTDILTDQVNRIESIVKNFLQTTAKPASQRQLVDLNRIVDKTLNILKPRIDGLQADLKRNLDRTLGPLRLVPTDLEQILLNFANNALDSLVMKQQKNADAALELSISTRKIRKDATDWAVITIYDTGLGIRKSDLKNVAKAFYTTKPPGQGTGLGLTICQQLAAKYGGMIEIDSKEGAWAEFQLRLPYREQT